MRIFFLLIFVLMLAGGCSSLVVNEKRSECPNCGGETKKVFVTHNMPRMIKGISIPRYPVDRVFMKCLNCRWFTLISIKGT